MNARNYMSRLTPPAPDPTGRHNGRWLQIAGGALAAGLVLALGVAGAQSLPLRQAHAQETPVPESAGITVVGEGVVRAKPDTITLPLGVEVNAQTPAAALSRTRETAERVLQRLREQGVAEADLQTAGLNVFRMQDGPPRDAGSSPPTSYRGYAQVTAKVPDVAKAGALLEAAVQAGATSVEGLSYGVRDDAALRREAIAAAVRDARPQAEAAAAAAGLRLAGVRAVTELASPAPPKMQGLGGGAGPGIAPGEVSVVVRAQVTFDVTR